MSTRKNLTLPTHSLTRWMNSCKILTQISIAHTQDQSKSKIKLKKMMNYLKFYLKKKWNQKALKKNDHLKIKIVFFELTIIFK